MAAGGSSGGTLWIKMLVGGGVLVGAAMGLENVQDDGKVNWVETATMVAVFGVTIYFLAQRG